MDLKETTTISINLLHMIDLIDVLTKDIHYIPSEERRMILKDQILLAKYGLNNILKMVDDNVIKED